MAEPAKTYRFSYQTASCFSLPVAMHFFKLRALPLPSACCTIKEEDLTVFPPTNLLYAVDGFGSRVQFGTVCAPHIAFAYSASGVVECTPYAADGADFHPIYLHPGRLTRPDAALRDFALGLQAHFSAHQDNFARALYLSGALYERMHYVPGRTRHDTPAAEAFAGRQGVCQDYAQILIVLCRLCGIGARYAAGFLEGEGSTHAWVEVFCGGVWRGIDPTHNRAVDFGCVKTAHGRDGADCPVNRGSFRGFTQESCSISVSLQRC